jgi:hypothetical protein
VSECAADADLFCPACCLLASWSLDGDTLDSSLNAVDLVNSGLTFESSSSNEPCLPLEERGNTLDRCTQIFIKAARV